MNQQFTICIRAKQNDVKVKVNVDDDSDTVFEKIVEKYPSCLNKKKMTLNRIKQQLQMRLRDSSVKSDLQQSIRYFLNSSFNMLDESTKSQNQIINQSRLVKNAIQKIIDFQPLKEKSADINRQTDQIGVYKNKGDTQSLKQEQWSSNIDNRTNQAQNKYLKTNKNNDKKGKTGANNVKEVRLNQKKAAVNLDMVKACQSIIKKSTQVDMKNMARQYLKQTGFHNQNSLTSHPKRYRPPSAKATTQQKTDQPQNTPTLLAKGQDRDGGYSTAEPPRAQQRIEQVCYKRRLSYGSNKYRYLDSSVLNQATRKAQEQGSIVQTTSDKVKKYNYLPAPHKAQS